MSDAARDAQAPEDWQTEIRRVEQLLFTVDETAQMLRVSRSRVFRLLRSNHLASVRIGGSRRVTRDAIEQFVEQLQSGALQVPA